MKTVNMLVFQKNKSEFQMLELQFIYKKKTILKSCT